MDDKKKPKMPSPSDDLVPPSMLPDKSVIPPGKGYGDDVKKKPPVKKAGGGSIKSSASRRADGCAVRGKTRGKFV